jgi:hypothetical protein
MTNNACSANPDAIETSLGPANRPWGARRGATDVHIARAMDAS